MVQEAQQSLQPGQMIVGPDGVTQQVISVSPQGVVMAVPVGAPQGTTQPAPLVGGSYTDPNTKAVLQVGANGVVLSRSEVETAPITDPVGLMEAMIPELKTAIENGNMTREEAEAQLGQFTGIIEVQQGQAEAAVAQVSGVEPVPPPTGPIAQDGGETEAAARCRTTGDCEDFFNEQLSSEGGGASDLLLERGRQARSNVQDILPVSIPGATSLTLPFMKDPLPLTQLSFPNSDLGNIPALTPPGGPVAASAAAPPQIDEALLQEVLGGLPIGPPPSRSNPNITNFNQRLQPNLR